MKSFFFLISLCVSFPLFVKAQFDEAGIFLGISHYAGDLTERNLEPLEFGRAGGIYVRKRISGRTGVRFHLMKAKISGSDANSSAESGLWKRNLRFESEIVELGAVFEYAFFDISRRSFGTSPYVYAGVAGFYFNPLTELEGRTYALRTFRTEGVNYSLYQFAIPFGAGLQVKINKVGRLGIQAGFRKTFTDYLDDVSGTYPLDLFATDSGGETTRLRLSYRSPEVDDSASDFPKPGSQRGNPDRKDWYMFFGVSVGVKL